MADENASAGTTPVTDALVQISFAVLDLLSRAAADLDLSVTQLRLIGILRDRSPSMAALADFLRLDRSSVSGLIDRAEKRGLVVRRASEHDARVTLIDLTPAGRALGERLGVVVSGRMETLLAKVPPSEQDAITRAAESILPTPVERQLP
jgi:DNA-binding MarR family transcriptional regulator